MAKPAVDAGSDHSLQAVGRIEFGQADEALPAESLAGLGIEPIGRGKERQTEWPGDGVTLDAMRQYFVPGRNCDYSKRQPYGQSQPVSAIPHPAPRANRGMKNEPIKGNPDQHHQVKNCDEVNDAQKALG